MKAPEDVAMMLRRHALGWGGRRSAREQLLGEQLVAHGIGDDLERLAGGWRRLEPLVKSPSAERSP